MVNAVRSVLWQRWAVSFRVYPWSDFLGVLMGEILSLLVGWLLYQSVFAGAVSEQFSQMTGGANYITFLAIGLGTHINLMSILLAVGRSLISEQREGTLEPLLLTPVSRVGYTMGAAIYQVLMQIPPAAALIVLARLLGGTLHTVNVGAAAFVVVIALVSFYGMSLILAAVMLAIRETFITQNTTISAIYLLSGVLFPIAYLPAPLQWLAKLLPPTWVIQLLRSALLAGKGPADLPAEFAVAIALAVLYTAGGILLLRRVERMALAGATW